MIVCGRVWRFKCTAMQSRQCSAMQSIDITVQPACAQCMRQSPGAIQALEWSDKALFGLVSGGHRWHLKPQGKKLLGLIGKNRTQVTLDQEITGGLPF